MCISQYWYTAWLKPYQVKILKTLKIKRRKKHFTPISEKHLLLLPPLVYKKTACSKMYECPLDWFLYRWESVYLTGYNKPGLQVCCRLLIDFSISVRKSIELAIEHFWCWKNVWAWAIVKERVVLLIVQNCSDCVTHEFTTKALKRWIVCSPYKQFSLHLVIYVCIHMLLINNPQSSPKNQSCC